MNLKKTTLVALSNIFFIAAIALYFNINKEQKVLGTESSMESTHGIIVPHHELAHSLISSTVEEISKENTYTNIVIIGPNHFVHNSPTIVTATDSEMGNIDKEYLIKLADKHTSFTFNDELVRNEHSVNIPLKYLSEFYPDAIYSLLVVSPYFDINEINEIANDLSQKEDTLFVLSIDFAHNVGIDEGLENNKETIDSIANFNYNKILEYTDKNMDSPVSTILFLKIMENLEAKNWTTITSNHGEELLETNGLLGTSYVTGYFK